MKEYEPVFVVAYSIVFNMSDFCQLKIWHNSVIESFVLDQLATKMLSFLRHYKLKSLVKLVSHYCTVNKYMVYGRLYVNNQWTDSAVGSQKWILSNCKMGYLLFMQIQQREYKIRNAGKAYH